MQTTARSLEFVTKARRILAEVETLRATMLSDLPFGGRLRPGVLPSIGPYLLPQAMKSLHTEQPDLRVIVREENTLSLDEGLRNGRFDAIISTPEDHPNNRQHPLFVEPVWAAVARDHPLSGRERIGTTDLSGQRLLTLDTNHRLARIVYGIAGQSGAIVSDDYEGTSLDSIILMAATGAGIGILPDLFARRQAIHRSEVRVIPLNMPEADRTICLLSPADREPRATEQLSMTLRSAARAYQLKVLGS